MSAAADPRLAALAAALPGVLVRLRRMRRGLLSARRVDGTLILTLHPMVLDDPDCSVFIKPWLAHRGRHGSAERLRSWLETMRQAAIAREAETQTTYLQTMATVGDHCDLQSHAVRIHTASCADLDLPPVRWGRSPPRRRLRHLRFGCYRRGAAPVIEICPRLARPWVAIRFLEHVLHHELCHHRQFRCGTPRAEGVHSPRFRTWERSYPGHAEALLWERLALPWLLDDLPPPWYRRPPCDA